MYQIDVPSAASQMPAPAAAGVPGYFTDGDPVGGTPGTIVPADFLNMLMVEFLTILAKGGTAPSKNDRGQLAAAMPKISGTPADTLVLTFPSGLIVQLGSGVAADNSGATAIVFPKAFTSGCIGFATNRAGGPPSANHGVGGESKTGMTVYSASSSTIAAAAGTAFRWLAIGF